MNANDAALTRLITAQTGSLVEDQSPNAPAHTSFDLIVEAVAGNVIGSSGAPYKLHVSATDLTTVTPALTPVTLTGTFDTATGWKLSGGTGPDYEYVHKVTVPVPAGVAGHTFRYIASLYSVNGQVVSLIDSEPFVLI